MFSLLSLFICCVCCPSPIFDAIFSIFFSLCAHPSQKAVFSANFPLFPSLPSVISSLLPPPMTNFCRWFSLLPSSSSSSRIRSKFDTNRRPRAFFVFCLRLATGKGNLVGGGTKFQISNRQYRHLWEGSFPLLAFFG